MPSKAKKQSKTPLRTPNSEKPPASPRTPLVSSLDSGLSEEDLNCLLEEASRRFPSLIGKSAFIGRVSDADSESKGCKIWLSEASMVSASLTPGSIVSVSIAALDCKFSNSFPLSSISEDSADGSNKEAGNYFALAAVFPSSKIVKNGVRLSSQLSYTLGRPTSGRVVFVYSVKSQLVTDTRNGREESQNNEVNFLPLRSCSKLYLELANVQNTFRSDYMVSKREFSNGKTRDHFRNAVLSSPRTPITHIQPSSPSASSLASQTDEESVLGHLKSTSLGSLDVKEILRDESAKKLIQTSAASMLYSRSLLFGNIVSIPILSEICIFHVRGADISRKDLASELHHSSYSPALEGKHHQVDAFFVGRETEVCLYLSRDSRSETSQDGNSRTIRLGPDNLKIRIEHGIKKLGGLSKEYEVLKEIIISSSVKNNLSSFGLRATKGVLLHGPPGTGKTALARLCIHDSGLNLFTVNGPEIVSQYYGASEQALSEVFESATKAAPSAVFIDELDAIAPARKDGGEELSQRMVATLLNLIDGISRNDGVLVIAATNRLDSIEPALRRPGRLDKELEIGVPSSKQRLDILHTLLSEIDHCLSDLHVQHLAMATHGFVGADLASLCNEAALVCLRRYTESAGSSGGLHSNGISGEKEDSIDHEDEAGSENDSTSKITCVPFSSMVLPSVRLREPAPVTTDSFQDDVISNSEANSFVEENCLLKVNFEDFEKARMKVRPSAMREVILEVPRVNWEDVGGQREIKTQLIEAVLWPQKHQDAFQRIGTRPPTGVLLFGPPGCSKTLMARAVASEAGLNFLAVKGPELFSKWVGESEKAVRSLFAKARANAPSIIFFDEIDSLAMIRGKENDGVSVSDRVMSQLLVELDGLHQRVDVTVIAATNRPDKIDPALLRPGRFDRLLYVGTPNKSDREDIFRIHLRKIPCRSDVSVKDLACLTEGCTGADISLICREAAIAALEESLDAGEVTMQNLKDAIKKVRPSEIQLYHDLSAKFQRLVQSTAGVEKSENQQCSSETKQSSSFRSLTKYVSWFF